jgi:hypothetical protein
VLFQRLIEISVEELVCLGGEDWFLRFRRNVGEHVGGSGGGKANEGARIACLTGQSRHGGY